jgi:Tol biopolymer transport system component
LILLTSRSSVGGELHREEDHEIARPLRIGIALAIVNTLFVVVAPSAMGLGAGGQKGNGNTGGPGISGDGHQLFFGSTSTNLTPESLDGGGSYIRNLDTGVVSFVNANVTSLSADGRFAVFDFGSASPNNVYVRDLQTGTTTLLSRATGANGAPANQNYGFMEPSISADGRFVAFQTNAPLDPVDADTNYDVYVRDLETDTTILVSRAAGPSGVKGNDWSNDPSISSDGRFVAFTSTAYNLDAGDTDRVRDIYRRDLQTNTITLVSRADGTAGFKADRDCIYPRISANGRYIAFQSGATSLNGDGRIYVRDVQNDRTVSAAPGTGLDANGAEYPAMSADGRSVAFDTSVSLSPADTDSTSDVYLRDLQTSTTSLVSRASGPAGADGNASSSGAAISGDGRLVAFVTGATNLSPDDLDQFGDVYVRDMQTSQTSLESRATPGYLRYVRPKGATPIRASLVPAAQPCAAPNETHGGPLAFGSCSPGAPASPNLVVSFGEYLAKSIGSVRLTVIPGEPATFADEADVAISFKLTNVMRASDASDYTGELQGRTTVRMTDKFNGSSAAEEGTVADLDLAFTIPCAATGSTTLGAECALTTTADTVLPGFAPEGKRAVDELGQFRVYDGGADDDATTTGDNTLFMDQGVFVP